MAAVIAMTIGGYFANHPATSCHFHSPLHPLRNIFRRRMGHENPQEATAHRIEIRGNLRFETIAVKRFTASQGAAFSL